MEGCGITFENEEARTRLLADQPNGEKLLSFEIRMRNNKICNDGYKVFFDLMDN